MPKLGCYVEMWFLFSNQGWERHGNYCYKVYKTEVSFGAQCNLTVMNR